MDAASRDAAGAVVLASLEKVVYNAERQALQVYGCNGDLVASMPVQAEMLAEVITVLALRHV